MGIQEWSDQIVLADLADDPLMADELDLLIEQLAAGRPRDVLIDLRGVTFLNSSNLARLLRLRKGQQDRHRRLRLCEPSDAIWSVFMVTGLDALFEFATSVTTALAELQMDRP